MDGLPLARARHRTRRACSPTSPGSSGLAFWLVLAALPAAAAFAFVAISDALAGEGALGGITASVALVLLVLGSAVRENAPRGGHVPALAVSSVVMALLLLRDSRAALGARAAAVGQNGKADAACLASVISGPTAISEPTETTSAAPTAMWSSVSRGGEPPVATASCGPRM